MFLQKPYNSQSVYLYVYEYVRFCYLLARLVQVSFHLIVYPSKQLPIHRLTQLLGLLISLFNSLVLLVSWFFLLRLIFMFTCLFSIYLHFLGTFYLRISSRHLMFCIHVYVCVLYCLSIVGNEQLLIATIFL